MPETRASQKSYEMTRTVVHEKKKKHVQNAKRCMFTHVAQAHMVHGYFVFTGSLWALCWQWIFLLAVVQPVKRHSWHDSQSLETLVLWQRHLKSDTQIHVAIYKGWFKMEPRDVDQWKRSPYSLYEISDRSGAVDATGLLLFVCQCNIKTWSQTVKAFVNTESNSKTNPYLVY